MTNEFVKKIKEFISINFDNVDFKPEIDLSKINHPKIIVFDAKTGKQLFKALYYYDDPNNWMCGEKDQNECTSMKFENIMNWTKDKLREKLKDYVIEFSPLLFYNKVFETYNTFIITLYNEPFFQNMLNDIWTENYEELTSIKNIPVWKDNTIENIIVNEKSSHHFPLWFRKIIFNRFIQATKQLEFGQFSRIYQNRIEIIKTTKKGTKHYFDFKINTKSENQIIQNGLFAKLQDDFIDTSIVFGKFNDNNEISELTIIL